MGLRVAFLQPLTLGLTVMLVFLRQEPPAAGRQVVIVSMTPEDQFEPQVVTIYSGEEVEWRNEARSVRTVIGDPLWAQHRSDIEPPSPPEPFCSDAVEPGQRFRHQFTLAGVYRYVCFEREGEGMNGTIIVRPRP